MSENIVVSKPNVSTILDEDEANNKSKLVDEENSMEILAFPEQHPEAVSTLERQQQ